MSVLEGFLEVSALSGVAFLLESEFRAFWALWEVSAFGALERNVLEVVANCLSNP